MKQLSANASEDIVKLYGGREWAELVDILLPSGFTPSLSELEWMAKDADDRYHILVTNAAAPVCLPAEGWRTGSYTADYKVYFNVPYRRDDIEDANENSGMVKTRITVGDTSGTIKSVMDRTFGLAGLDVKMAWAMVHRGGADAARELLDAPTLTDAEAVMLADRIAAATSQYGVWPNMAAKETSGGVFALSAILPLTATYTFVQGCRLDDTEMATVATGGFLATNLDGTSTDFDILARGTQDGVFVRVGGGSSVEYTKITGVSEGGALLEEEVPSFPEGGSLQWFQLSQDLVDGMAAIKGAVGSLPDGSVFAMTPDLEYSFVSGASAHDRTSFAFQLSTRNPLSWRFPARTIYKGVCQWAFKSPECGYTGNATSCARTIAACKELNNIERIGCFPGCGSGGLAR